MKSDVHEERTLELFISENSKSFTLLIINENVRNVIY